MQNFSRKIQNKFRETRDAYKSLKREQNLQREVRDSNDLVLSELIRNSHAVPPRCALIDNVQQ